MSGFLTFRDLTHLQWTSGEVINTLTAGAHLFIFAFSPSKRALVGWSQNSFEVFGIRDVEVARDGNLFLRHAHVDDRFGLLNEIENAFQHHAPLKLVYRWQRPDNSEVRWLLCRAEPVERSDGLIYEGIVADISDEMQSVGGDLRYESGLFEALQTWIAVLDADGQVLYRHVPAALVDFNFGDAGFSPEEFCKSKELISCFSNSSYGSKVKDLLRRAMLGKIECGNVRVLWNNSVVDVEIKVIPSKFGTNRLFVLARDCSDLVNLQSEAIRLKRAESFAQLSAGVLHNLNNSLQSIVGYAAAIRSHPRDKVVVENASSSIMQLVEQASGLSHQALALRDSIFESISPLDLNASVMSALHKVQDLLSSGTKIAVSLGTLPMVTSHYQTVVDAIEKLLRIVHANLNATQALAVQTTQLEVSIGAIEGLRKGTHCRFMISISPQGGSTPRTKQFSSIDSATLQEATTTLARVGAVVHYEQHSSGSESISIYFPVSSEPRSSPRHKPRKSSGPPQILVVDDEALVREIITVLLNDAGYRTLGVADRKGALHAVKRYGQSIKVVLVDALLGNDRGAAIIRQIRKVRSEIIAIGITGASTVEMKELTDAGAVQTLQKPIIPKKLLDTVKQWLAQRKAA